MGKITTLGRCLFAVAALASGLQQLVTAGFVRLVPGFPAWIPWPHFWALGSGLLLVLAGGALVLDRRVRLGAMILGAMLILLFLGFYLPQIFANPQTGFIWTNPCKTLALLGGAIILAGLPAEGNAGGSSSLGTSSEGFRFLGWFFLSVFLVICGVQHFIYADFVDTLVPKWIPPGQRFWTYFSAVALIAGGVGLVLPKTARLAALLSGLMVFLWVLLLHLPRTVAMKTTFELDGVFEALAISGVALLVAGTLSRESRGAAVRPPGGGI
jgi:uncharacterized membrane protein